MPTLEHLPGGAPQAQTERFELAYADERGEQRVSLTEAWSVAFEDCAPVRGFRSYKGQHHFNGRWWTATTDTLVGYESWLERDHVLSGVAMHSAPVCAGQIVSGIALTKAA
ncbi:hypothetical protein P3102_10545 [Amycolatopsis sp. QT-25]|uniref:hypothetical protein n=1 Tax=Amycolatopsis sp. QT-25 TaxID=3034022 RepID=UPI0023EAF56D|nr:hypothetical protein [Amycolatopsis sp. QT-25]WET81613.1 hypothetical protein P3102_10545 [Amycolatopsis sp. QT-25]